jgi:serine/threonine-protein kinase
VLLYVIGRGAMADVYAAFDVHLGVEVAIKVIRPELAQDSATVARFKREAAAISRLDHPNIIRLTGTGISEDGLVYLVLERLVGRTLEDYIHREAPVEPRRCAQLLSALCDALHALHSLGIMHRDLKPANVFLARTPKGAETVVLLDFGIARRLRHDPVDDKLSGGKVLGSVCYAAPEIARKGTLDQRTDLYSIGVIAYELLSGQLPFDGPTPLAVLRAQVQDHIPPLPDWIPEPYQLLCFELLAKNPDYRPPDAAEVARRFRELAMGLPILHTTADGGDVQAAEEEESLDWHVPAAPAARAVAEAAPAELPAERRKARHGRPQPPRVRRDDGAGELPPWAIPVALAVGALGLLVSLLVIFSR